MRIQMYCMMLMCWVSAVGQTAAVNSLWDAFEQGRPTLDVRFRVESVDQDLFNKEALAATLRTRLGYQTADYQHFSFFLEFENITAVDDTYNSTTNGTTDRPVVADPETTEVNQAAIDFKANGQLLRVGRQRIVLDNTRFIGNVGWRQNEQTYDAALWKMDLPSKSNLLVAYLHQVNRVFGDDHPQGNWGLRGLLAQGAIGSWKIGAITPFVYLLENRDLPGDSHKDIGVRLDGLWKPASGPSWAYEACFADQSSYRDGADSYDNQMICVAFGPRWANQSAKLGFERLGGNGTRGFATPFATLHAFNGWADMFLTTPANGLDDLWLEYGRNGKAWKASVAYHDYQSDENSQDYGSELDAQFSYSLSAKMQLGVKLADYSADAFASDTRKAWIWSQLTW